MLTAKVFGCILMLCIFSSNSAEINDDVQETCGKKFEVDPAEAAKIIKSYDPIPEIVMCYSKCYMKGTHMMNKDGTMIAEKAFEMMFPGSKDENVKNMIKEIVAMCNRMYNKDTCELAGNMYRCIRENIIAKFTKFTSRSVKI